MALGSRDAAAAEGGPVAPPSTITSPPRDFGPNGAPTTYFTDPDVLTVDPSFDGLRQPNAPIQRLWTGSLWAEGPAWNSQGRYLVWSDIPNNRQMRWLEDDGHVSVFRMPSNNGNGNTFDFQGRQLTCEHLTRRVVRYELDGSVTVIADNYNGKHLNSPNDVVLIRTAASGSPIRPMAASSMRARSTRRADRAIRDTSIPSLASRPDLCRFKRELPTNVYRWDPSGKLDIVVTEEQIPDPNGILFSPDYQEALCHQHRKGARGHRPGGKGDISVFDVGADNKLSNQKLFTDCVVDGVKCGPDGMRCDVDGNVWCSSNAGRAVGYSGVTVWNPAGKLIGRIRIPEVVANICFGGPKRNRLFIAASQSLYALYTATQGAAPAERRLRLQMGRQAVDDATRRPQVGYACRSKPGRHVG